MIAKSIYPVILCGGSGTRLWPLSRKNYPKQFTKLTGEESLFQASARRLSGPAFKPPIIVTGEPFRFIVTEQLSEICTKPSAVLLEPEPRNTAPAVLAAALWLAALDPDALVLVAPSDHVIPDANAFRSTVSAAVPRAQAGDLVAFGVIPTRPETGYGYLELAAGASAIADEPQPLVCFAEKPDALRAAQMIVSGNFLWNAGIFLFSVGAIIAAYRAYGQAMVESVGDAIARSTTDLGFTRLAADPWLAAEDISIDYAILEKAANLSVMPLHTGWSDLGNWSAVWSEIDRDEHGNGCSRDATAVDCRDTLLHSETGGLQLVGIGLQDIVAVAMADAVLVAHMKDIHRVKEAVAALSMKGASQASSLPHEHRPWGWFETLAVGAQFKVKRIVVNPGSSLSLQSHAHRAEHWIVVQGAARVTLGADVRLVTANQSVYVPVGAIHRLENPGVTPVILIEVQTGSYLDEDDIIRHDDVYSRN